MELAIAIYAAFVATGGIAWQVYVWSHRRRPDVRVTTRPYMTEEKPPEESWEEFFPYRAEGTSSEGGMTFYPMVEVVVVNHGETNEVAEDVGIAAVEPGGLFRSSGAGAAIGSAEREGPDKPLPPGGFIKLKFPEHRLPEKVRETGRFVGYAQLVSGSRVESSPDRLIR